MKVLVTAASRHGSTAEIAQIIAAILRRPIEAEVLAPEAVDRVDGYEAVILGSACTRATGSSRRRAFVARHATSSRTARCSCSRAARSATRRSR